MKLFYLSLALSIFTLTGCHIFSSAEHGAEAAATADPSKPMPPPPAGDDRTAYTIAYTLALAAMVAVDKLTGGVVSRNTIGGLVEIVKQHVEALASSVPVDAHAQALQGLAQSVPVTTPSPVAPRMMPAS